MEVAKDLEQEVRSFLEETEITLDMLFKFSAVKKNDTEEMTKLFEEIAQNHPYFSYLYLGTTNGGMKSFPKDDWSGFDPRERPWYKRAKQEGEMIWTDVFVDAASGQPIIGVAVPIKDQTGELIGVLGGDVRLKTLSQKIVNKKIGENGYVYMVNQEGRIIAHPEQKLVEEGYDINNDFNLNPLLEQGQG
ncbi:cache domain-containing protein [Halanaerobaculum tunisiense]